MLTNEQCIEIAEKVWGWTYLTANRSGGVLLAEGGWFADGARQYPLIRADEAHVGSGKFISLGIRFDEEIQREVNSWQGFGRTVEAMAEREWWLNKSVEGVWFYRYRGMNCIKTMGRDTGMTSESLFKAVHLAALEAINDNQ